MMAVEPRPIVDQRPQCWRCEKVLADFVARPWQFTCPRCKATVKSQPEQERAA